MITLPQSRESLALTLPDGSTKFGFLRYKVYLGVQLIGFIYTRNKGFYYAKPEGDFPETGKTFRSKKEARDWLIDCYYSLADKPVEIEQHDGVYYVFRDNKPIGECHYSQVYQEWTVYAKPGEIRIYSDRFSTLQTAIDFIVTKSLDPDCDLTQYLVSLENEFGFSSLEIKVDPTRHCWHKWIEEYNEALGIKHNLLGGDSYVVKNF